MQPIQLPTSTELLFDKLVEHYEFTKALNVEKERRGNDPYSLHGQFYATFDKEAELRRLRKLGMALLDGVKTLEFA